MEGSLLFKDFNPVTRLGLAAGIVAIDYTQILTVYGIEFECLGQPVKGGAAGGFYIIDGLGFLSGNLTARNRTEGIDCGNK